MVTLIDGLTLRVRRVLRGFGEPRYTAAALGSELAYISDSYTHGEVVVLDTARGPRVVGRVAVGGPARHVIAVMDSEVWTALGARAEQIAVVDVSLLPERPRLARTFRPPWLAHDVGFTPGGRTGLGHVRGQPPALAVYGARSRQAPRDAPARTRRRSTSRSSAGGRT